MSGKYIKDLPSTSTLDYDGYIIYEDGTTTYRTTVNSLINKLGYVFVYNTGDTINGNLVINSDLTVTDTTSLNYTQINENYNLLFGGNNKLILNDDGAISHSDIYATYDGTNGSVLRIDTPDGVILNNKIITTSFVKSGGTSGQYLMADGSVSTLSSLDSRFVNVTGDTMTGTLNIKNIQSTGTTDTVSLYTNLTNGNINMGYDSSTGTTSIYGGNIVIGAGGTTTLGYGSTTVNIGENATNINIAQEGSVVNVGTSDYNSTLNMYGDVNITGNTKISSSIQIGTTSDVATSGNTGTIRYRVNGNTSYCEMVMQTGATNYGWVTIKSNTW